MSSAVIGALRVVFGADTAAFEKGVTKAERRTNKFQRKMQDTGKKIANVWTAIAGAATAAAVGFAAAANKMAADARQIGISADIAGESFERFQKQAFAAKSVGIEMEKLSDIFKDVRDRVGDFVATGGGPMADFFEKIAPKVGVTADAFRGLSGKDALQLYYNSLKQANVSQEEMVFYLEAMASDATNLIPLLEENGRAFERLGENAEIITDEQRADLEKYTRAQENLSEASRKLLLQLTPLISGVADFMNAMADSSREVDISRSKIENVIIGFKLFWAELQRITSAIGGFLSAIGLTGERLSWLASKAQELANPLYAIINLFEAVGRKAGAANDMLGANHAVGLMGKGFQLLRDQSMKLNTGAGSLPQLSKNIGGVGRSATRAAGQVREAKDEFLDLIESLFPERMSRREEQQLNFIEANADRLEKLGIRMWQARRAILGGTDLGEGEVSETGPLNDLMIQTDELTYDFKKAAGVLEDQNKRIGRSFQEMATDALNSLRTLTDGIKSGDFLDILNGVIGIFTQLGGMGVFGKNIQTNLARPRSFDGGGYTGSGSRVGGIDGRGGFMAVLHPNETVIDHTKGRMAANDGGTARVMVGIDPRNGNVTAYVDGRIQTAAPAIASGGAQLANVQGARMQKRSYR